MAKGIKRILFLVIATYYLLPTTYNLLPTTCHLYAQDKIIAIVNNEVITQKDLDDFISFTRVQLSQEYKGKELESKIQEMKLDLLDKLIEDRVILQEARRNNIKVDESLVRSRLEEIKRHYQSDIDFQHALSQQGFTQSDIESKIREQLLMFNIINYKVRNNIVVSPNEVTDFFQKNNDDFKSPTQREVEVINMNDEALGKDALTNLQNGENLKDVAQKYSLKIDELTVAQDGRLRKDIEDEIFNLTVGGISGLIKIEQSYYIFKLAKIIPERKLNLPEVQDKIYRFLLEKKTQGALLEWLDGLKKNSYIKICQN